MEAGEAGRKARGLGVCAVTLVARLPWLIRSASTPRGAASRPHSAFQWLRSSALRRTVDLQKKSQSLVVLSCHRPGGSQRTGGTAQKGAALGMVPTPLLRWDTAGSLRVPPRGPEARQQAVATLPSIHGLHEHHPVHSSILVPWAQVTLGTWCFQSREAGGTRAS